MKKLLNIFSYFSIAISSGLPLIPETKLTLNKIFLDEEKCEEENLLTFEQAQAAVVTLLTHPNPSSTERKKISSNTSNLIKTHEAIKAALQRQVNEKESQLQTEKRKKAVLQKQFDEITANQTVLQKQLSEKENQLQTEKAEKAALQRQFDKKQRWQTYLQDQLQTEIAEKAALQKQLDEIVASQTALQIKKTKNKPINKKTQKTVVTQINSNDTRSVKNRKCTKKTDTQDNTSNINYISNRNNKISNTNNRSSNTSNLIRSPQRKLDKIKFSFPNTISRNALQIRKMEEATQKLRMALTNPNNTKSTRSTIKNRNALQTSEVKEAKNVLMKVTNKAIKTTEKLRMALTNPNNTKITRSTIRNTNLLTLEAQKVVLAAENILVHLIEPKPVEQTKSITEK